jgi:hypothetical protein
MRFIAVAVATTIFLLFSVCLIATVEDISSRIVLIMFTMSILVGASLLAWLEVKAYGRAK